MTLRHLCDELSDSSSSICIFLCTENSVFRDNYLAVQHCFINVGFSIQSELNKFISGVEN